MPVHSPATRVQRGFWRSAVTLLAVGALCGCSPGTNPADAPPVRIAALGAANSADPLKAQSSPERLVAGEVHLGLLRINSNGQLAPGLAESWRVSDDGLTYLFRLKPTKWPDGKDVTCVDVAASLRRAVRDRPDLPALGELDAIEGAVPVRARRKSLSAFGIRVLTPDVMEIRLSRPAPALLALLAEPNLVITRSVRAKNGGNERYALGPYRLTTEKTQKAGGPDQTHYDLTLQGKPRPNQPWNVRILPFSGTEDAIQAFRSGRVDVVLGGQLEGVADARAIGGVQNFRAVSALGVVGLRINLQRPLLADARVRRALAMAIDRPAIVGRLFNLREMLPLVSLVPPTVTGYATPTAPNWANWALPQRQTEARRLLIEAGYSEAALATLSEDDPESKALRIEISFVDGVEARSVIQAIAEAWAPLGIRVRALARNPDNQAAILEAGDFDMAFEVRTESVDSPLPFLRVFACDQGQNFGRYCNPDADAMITRAQSLPDIVQRTAELQMAEAAMLNDMPFLPLFVPARWSLLRAEVEGWSPSASGVMRASSLRWRGKGG